MPFVFNNSSTLGAIREMKFALSAETGDCIYDFAGGKFFFRDGRTDCEKPLPIDQIGAAITKSAITEMINRFNNTTGLESNKIFSIDYGKKILTKILSESNGIRFYFGLRDKGDGSNFMSLILVGLNEKGEEMVAKKLLTVGMPDGEIAGDEVGHGNSYADLKKPSNKNKFIVANFVK